LRSGVATLDIVDYNLQAMKETYYHVRIVQYTKHTTWDGKKPNDEWLPTTQAEYHCADSKEVLSNVEKHLKS